MNLSEDRPQSFPLRRSPIWPDVLFPLWPFPAQPRAPLSRHAGQFLKSSFRAGGRFRPKVFGSSEQLNSCHALTAALLSPAQHKGPQSLLIGVYTFQRSIAEPVGGSTPKFSGELTIKGLVKPLNLPFSLSCPAQGSPLPSFRFVVISPFCRAGWRLDPKVFT